MGDDAAAALLAHLTDAQRRAVLTADRSLLVSAAAGAGKTMVLAERCAALVCDLPDPYRCSVDELLVVTFTEAAATEMRTRIGRAIRARLERRPNDARLQQQLYRLDNASISTIHAFCRALIRRWFPQAGVDPQLAVLAAEETDLLQREVLETLLTELYAGQDAFAMSFQALVDDYGSGRDRQIVPLVLDIYAFISSLPNPAQWLQESIACYAPDDPSAHRARLHAIQHERLLRALRLHAENARHVARTIACCWPIATLHADTASEFSDELDTWHERLRAGTPESWEAVAEDVRAWRFPRKSRPRNVSEEEKAAYDAALLAVNRMKKLFEKRVREAVCTFTVDGYVEGLACVAPYARTLVELVARFGQRYEQVKRAQAAADFNDLQRYAYRLLTVDGHSDRPSDVARQLQNQYRYVLVDEFQDVDPLQEAILHCVSRESADPPEGNLFTVGDIKQSIYRFRLAEPALFTDRCDRFASGRGPGEVIHLPDNFRSRPDVLEAINLLFRPLMRPEFGGTAYDATAELRAGATYPAEAQGPLFGRPAIEVHLIEPVTAATARAASCANGIQNGTNNDGNSAGNSEDSNDNDDGQDNGYPKDADEQSAEELEGIEREAYLIGRRISRWMGWVGRHPRWHIADRPATPGGPPRTRPVELGDIVILLRSLPYKAEPIAETLRRMGIPTRIEKQAAGLESSEFNDVLNLLRLLDNPCQDIPLAGFLRSPLTGSPYTESHLLTVRLASPDGPFHEAVQAYVKDGDDEDLSQRLDVTLANLQRWRDRIRQRPVAEVLWAIYEETGYLAYVAGLPGGRQRRDRLIQLHELARQFGQFTRQGLRRFLHFLENILEQGQSPLRSGVQGGDENVVRIMTVHASKGLEYPIVILADMSKDFNMQDHRRSVLIDRLHGIGMAVVDSERRIRYPSLLQQAAAEHMHREQLAEELRVLYVALTRAREHLVLVGRARPENVTICRQLHEAATRGMEGENGPRIGQLVLESATSYLSWLLSAVGAAPRGTVDWGSKEGTARDALIVVRVYGRNVTDGWEVPPMQDADRAVSLAKSAVLAELPAEEPLADEASVAPILDSLTHAYPALELAALPARIGVTELKRRWDASADPLERTHPTRGQNTPTRPAFLDGAPRADAVETGMATHRFLQVLDLARPCDEADLQAQLRELQDVGRISPEEARRVLLDGVRWFFGTDVGRRVRARAADVRREVAFVTRVAPSRLDASVQAYDPQDFVLVRGMIDLAWADGDGWEILDYKTDAVSADQVAHRAEHARYQLEQYAQSLEAVTGMPVTRCWLAYVHARALVEVKGGPLHVHE